MSDPFIGEIRMFAGNFAPEGWAFCNGATLPLTQNVALFSLLGTTYGGNGVTTFGLPNLQGRVPVGAGEGAGLNSQVLGQVGGSEQVTLTQNQLPIHDHLGPKAASTQTSDRPGSGLAPAPGGSYGPPDAAVTMAPTQPTGASQPFSIMQPSLGMNFIIALTGIFPSRS